MNHRVNRFIRVLCLLVDVSLSRLRLKTFGFAPQTFLPAPFRPWGHRGFLHVDLLELSFTRRLLHEKTMSADNKCQLPSDSADPKTVSSESESLQDQSNVSTDVKGEECQEKPVLSKRAQKRIERKERYKQMRKLSRPLTRNPDPGFGRELYAETSYYFENGLRKVYPYVFTFTTYVKERWYNKKIIDVFSSEFRANTPEDYRKAIEVGALTANGQKVSVDYILQHNDLLAHKIHRIWKYLQPLNRIEGKLLKMSASKFAAGHENPVSGSPIQVLADNDDVLVINKPASIPCHPCGKYRHNSIVFIVGKELGYSNLRNIYRLDRLTSGVLILGKTARKTKELENQVLNKQVQKEYVCRVVSKFPDGVVTVDQPLDCISHKVGLFKVSTGGKESKTSFERISYNGKSSVVRCIPHTGRTHQIRVHLQYLGFPIVNDPFYNSEAWGPNRGKGGVIENSEEEVARRIMEKHNVGIWTDGENPLFYEKLQEKQTDSEHECYEPVSKKCKTETENTAVSSDNQPGFESSKWIPDPNCDACRQKYIDPSPQDLIMYLHALNYKGPDWEYSTSVPDWAKKEWDED